MAAKVENFQHQKVVKLFGRFIQAGLTNDLDAVNAIAPDLIDALDASTTEQERHRDAAQFRATERAAQTLGIQVQMFEGRTATELDAALEAAPRSGVGAVLIFSSPVVFDHRARIAALGREKRLPTVSLFTEFAEAGGLLTYGPSLRESFRRSGVFAGKVLGGAKPADLPIERPEKFELVINLKTAKALGLTIPPSLLQRADQVIE
jgi:putative ABC transport system substrate-binding protein